MARDTDVPPIQTVKVVGSQSREFWKELQGVVNEAEQNGWTIRVLVEGDDAKASLAEFKAAFESESFETTREKKPRGLWARLFG